MTQWNGAIITRMMHSVIYFTTTACPTVRGCEKAMHIPKTTVHSDITKRFYEFINLDRCTQISLLPDVIRHNPLTVDNYNKIRNILDINMKERATRGGLSTKRMWENKNDAKEGII